MRFFYLTFVNFCARFCRCIFGETKTQNTMTTKHTKGVWKVKNLLHIVSDNKLIAHVDPIRGNVSDENCANAKLIAAAPDLLEALMAINSHWSNGNFSRDVKLWENMCNAINKATL